MMKSNPKKIGARFEEDFSKSIPEQYYFERYKDSPVMYKKVDNPADFFINSGKFVLLIECKTVKGNRIPLNNIRINQVWKMLVASTKLQTFGGFLINFREHNETYFIFISDFFYWYCNTTSKSLSIGEIRNMGYKISQKLKIKRWRYGIEGLLKWVEKEAYTNEF